MQLDLFRIQDAPKNVEGWFFWDPWISFTKDSLKLYSDVMGEDEFELLDYEEIGPNNLVCKFLVSPLGMERIEKWSIDRRKMR